MTALNVIVSHERAIILTDAAGYQPDGVVSSFRQKCNVIQPAGIAVATAGNSFLLESATRVVRGCFRDIDHAAAIGEEVFEAWAGGGVQETLALLAERYGSQTAFCVVMAGWSASKQRPIAIIFDNMAERRFTVGVGWSIAPDYKGREPINARLFSTDTSGVALLQCQRLLAPREAGVYGIGAVIGGFATETLITKDGITQREVGRWTDDVIGKAVTPTGPFVLTPNRARPIVAAPAMNRQQRRALERRRPMPAIAGRNPIQQSSAPSAGRK